jgi:hypothetical protein
MGRDKTDDLIRRSFYWKGLSRQVEKWIAACRKCQEHKGKQHTEYGLCPPLDVPTRPFWSISLDLISRLPLTPTGFNAIITVVDKFTKVVALIPCAMAISGRRVAQLLMEHVFCRYGFPGDIVSDRDTRFTNVFYRELCSRLGINQSMSAACHPESYGNTEVVNKVVETTIRAIVNDMQTNWSELLCMVEFAINNSKHSST